MQSIGIPIRMVNYYFQITERKIKLTTSAPSSLLARYAECDWGLNPSLPAWSCLLLTAVAIWAQFQERYLREKSVKNKQEDLSKKSLGLILEQTGISVTSSNSSRFPQGISLCILSDNLFEIPPEISPALGTPPWVPLEYLHQLLHRFSKVFVQVYF